MNKIEPNMVLFVGGPMDSRGRPCKPHLDYLDIPIIKRNSPISQGDWTGLKTHRYRRVKFSNSMSVFASNDLSDNDVLRYLILGYRQP